MSQYRTGTVTVTNGSATVTGSGTSWLTGVTVGSQFSLVGSGVSYTVGAVGSDTSITLTSSYAGSTASGQSYTITTSFTDNLELPYPERGDVDTATILKRALLLLDSLVGAGGLRWQKVGDGLLYTAFQTAATTKSNALFTLNAAGIIHAVKVKHSTAFAGGAIATCTISVGKSGENDRYASAFDVMSAVSATNYFIDERTVGESHTATTAVTVTAVSTGANLSALTAGEVDIWALISQASD